MSRRIAITAAFALAASPAYADRPAPPPDPAAPTDAPPPMPPTTTTPPPTDAPPPTDTPPAIDTPPALPVLDSDAGSHASARVAPADMSDQGIGAELGIASGGRVTPGGLRIAGHYLYQLAAQDWFDGLAVFTFGGGGAQCFRDRMDVFVCDHGLAQGDAIELAATVRHFFGATRQGFWPFARGGVGLGIVHYSADAVTGLVIPLHAGGGLRVSVAPAVALTFEGELELGFGAFNHTLGLEPQLGVAITAGAEFRL